MKRESSLKGVLDKRYARPEIDKGKIDWSYYKPILHQNLGKDLLAECMNISLGSLPALKEKGRRILYTNRHRTKPVESMISQLLEAVYVIFNGREHVCTEREICGRSSKEDRKSYPFMVKEMNATTWKLPLR